MHKKRNTGYQKNIFSATLFVLAILVLVVSCPLKGLLINNDVAQSSKTSKFKQTSNNKYSRILYSNPATDCAAKNEATVIEAYQSQFKKVDAPVFTINIFNHTGYYTHSFLDGIKADHHVAPGSGHSALPLFLQHRSLLI